MQQNPKVRFSAVRSRRPQASGISRKPSPRIRVHPFSEEGLLVRTRTNNKIHQLQPGFLASLPDSNKINNQHRRGFSGSLRQVRSSSNSSRNRIHLVHRCLEAQPTSQISHRDNKVHLGVLLQTPTSSSSNQLRRHLEAGEVAVLAQIRSRPKLRFPQAVMLSIREGQLIQVQGHHFSDSPQSHNRKLSLYRISLHLTAFYCTSSLG